MKILLFSSLYPNEAQPGHGVFVENRLRHLVSSGRVTATVVAPVPWFPVSWGYFGKYARFAKAPRTEKRNGLLVHHPRFMVIPKVGMHLAPLLMYLGVRSMVRKIIENDPEIQLIDAHYFYPDGIVAAMLGRLVNRPVVVTARGSDINVISEYKIPRKMILWSARQCAQVISVCQALKDSLVQMGVSGNHVTVLRNGVDLELFRRHERALARERTGMRPGSLLSVGNLVDLKGHHISIRAMKYLPECHLVIVGTGEKRQELERLAQSEGVGSRVVFTGAVSHTELPYFYSGADALVLASSREGMANVLLESIACGTPVIATRVSGTPEVVAVPEAGVLMSERTPESLVEAYRGLMAAYPSPESTRRYAESFRWDETTSGQLEIFNNAVAHR